MTNWSVGNADVSGTVTNATGNGCTDPELTLHLLDHNGAEARSFTFGLGEPPNKSQRTWHTHMVGLFGVAEPVEPSVTHVMDEVLCMDYHPLGT